MSHPMHFNKAKLIVSALGLLTAAITSAAAQVMPSDLIGNYTDSGAEQCEDFRIEPRRLFSEGMGCEVLSVKRLQGDPGNASSFAVSLSCQMDDPQKPKLTGVLTLDNIFNSWFLGVRLDVEPKLRKKFSYPPLQVFEQCVILTVCAHRGATLSPCNRAVLSSDIAP